MPRSTESDQCLRCRRQCSDAHARGIRANYRRNTSTDGGSCAWNDRARYVGIRGATDEVAGHVQISSTGCEALGQGNQRIGAGPDVINAGRIIDRYGIAGSQEAGSVDIAKAVNVAVRTSYRTDRTSDRIRRLRPRSNNVVAAADRDRIRSASRIDEVGLSSVTCNHDGIGSAQCSQANRARRRSQAEVVARTVCNDGNSAADRERADGIACTAGRDRHIGTHGVSQGGTGSDRVTSAVCRDGRKRRGRGNVDGIRSTVGGDVVAAEGTEDGKLLLTESVNTKAPLKPNVAP